MLGLLKPRCVLGAEGGCFHPSLPFDRPPTQFVPFLTDIKPSNYTVKSTVITEYFYTAEGILLLFFLNIYVEHNFSVVSVKFVNDFSMFLFAT